MFKRILLPVDGSERALRAVDTGLGLAAKLAAEVFSIHVLPPLSAVSYVAELLQHGDAYSELAKERAGVTSMRSANVHRPRAWHARRTLCSICGLTLRLWQLR